jgi:hypothetical protein
LLPHDKKLLNSFYNNIIDETIYYCCQCYSCHNDLFDNIVNKPSNINVFNFDLPKMHFHAAFYNIQLYESLYCSCGCECFSSDPELISDYDSDEDDDDSPDFTDEIIFNRSDSPIEPATDKLNECNICYTNKKNYACIPCGHLCMCKVCASKITEKCPICNIKITHITKIFT